MIQCIIFPDGKRIIVSQMQAYSVSGNNVTVEYSTGAASYVYNAGSASNAVNVIRAIDTAIQKGYSFFNLMFVGAT